LWKQRFRKDFSQDEIIFGEDDEIHEGIKLDTLDNLLQNSSTLNMAKQVSAIPGKKEKKEKQRSFARDQPISDQLWKTRFEQLLKLDLVELEDDYYEDKLFFTNPDVLDQKFTILEEENLFYIHRL